MVAGPPRLGFTGTREQLTQPQGAALFSLMRGQFPFELHHGDCKGADAEANAIFNSLRLGADERVVMHPQLNSELRAFCAPLHPMDDAIIWPDGTVTLSYEREGSVLDSVPTTRF